MLADDVTETLNLTLRSSDYDSARVAHKPHLLSNNGSSSISGDLTDWLQDHGKGHVRGAPYHPQTQDKIERWHQTLLKPRLRCPICFDDGQAGISATRSAGTFATQDLHGPSERCSGAVVTNFTFMWDEQPLI